ncbi:Exodeoxyribonuclease V beta chain [Citrobacter freundii]|uniref:Exodeoxyribonuclease V beta chain n=1 Tax=Citrobacter freundii TaxID=546 RepID=A0A7G2IRH4_CITFR|nr:Exodeoxyribonuclease V beta chain [Citrobacter freundii]
MEKFSQRFLEERTKAGGITPQHPLFVAIDELLSEPLTLCDLVITRALAEIRAAVAEEKRRRGELGLTICSAVWMQRCAVKAAMRWRRLFAPVFRLP